MKDTSPCVVLHGNGSFGDEGSVVVFIKFKRTQSVGYLARPLRIEIVGLQMRIDLRIDDNRVLMLILYGLTGLALISHQFEYYIRPIYNRSNGETYEQGVTSGQHKDKQD